MTLIQKLAEQNLFTKGSDDCTIEQGDIVMCMPIEILPFKLLVQNVIAYKYDKKNHIHKFILED